MMTQGTIWLATAIAPLAAAQYAAAATPAMQVTIWRPLSTLAVTPAARLWVAGRKDDRFAHCPTRPPLNTPHRAGGGGSDRSVRSVRHRTPAYGPAMRPASTLLLIRRERDNQAIFNVNVTVLIVGVISGLRRVPPRPFWRSRCRVPF